MNANGHSSLVVVAGSTMSAELNETVLLRGMSRATSIDSVASVFWGIYNIPISKPVEFDYSVLHLMPLSYFAGLCLRRKNGTDREHQQARQGRRGRTVSSELSFPNVPHLRHQRGV